MERVDLQLRVFVTVVEENSFTRAAEKLHISQPAISQHVQTLEQRLGVRLIDRGRRRLQVNPAGRIVYEHAKEILALYRRMERLIADMQEMPAGPVHVGASLTYGEYVLPHVIARFRQAYPAVQPSVSIANTQTIAHAVAVRQLDIGIVEGRDVVEDEVVLTPFAEDEMLVVASPTSPWYAERPDRSLLERATWFIREPGSGTREMTDRLFAQLGIQPRDLVEYTSSQVIKESVAAGLGLACLSRWVVARELTWGMLRALPIPCAPVKRTFSIVTPKSAFETKASKLLYHFLLEHGSPENPSLVGR
ncbi:transcriptional regulator, LysR family [Alicyclobacillus acidocaldarius subsp. acidocaldarius Tc-4-1]|uniref:Transcriptional regulator, LysR family n=1 Tax=Alicyclobacillus acidocaldarius (strain Tc-4-1) TaxID=1048834 RepID=F8IEB8_ALIAT|nr:transcriptional regulator, LysR family [Alicyclobacillus acidocaldarius subsp. acidocaldarius Tc-4-1]